MNLEIRSVSEDRFMAVVVHDDGHERRCNHHHETEQRADICGRAWRNRLARDQELGR
jgi:hypothetical protein